MGRKRGGWKEVIKGEVVRKATAEEAADIDFLRNRNGARLNLEALLNADSTLADVKKLLDEDPDAVALVIDTVYERMARLRTDLSKFGIEAITREAVSKYGESTSPYTIAVRRLKPTDSIPVEKKLPEPKSRVRVWSKE